MKRCAIACLFWLALWLPLTDRTASAEPSPVAGVDVLIDVGHGGIDGGTSHGDLLEKQLNLMVGKKIYDRLNAMGIRVAINRTHDFAPSDDNDWLATRSRHLRDLAQRKLLIDALNPKLTVSIHTNWAKNPSARGPGVLYQLNQPSHILAHLLADRLNALYGTKAVPYTGNTFYLLHRSKTPAVIVEMGYISNASDREMLTGKAGQTKIAEAVASAIVDYLIAFHVH
ncbi:N-acetylmuramoyl-L-alanine amidase [Paenibacillus hodogayensis]|uniref:N-acetylmuramoyl-L-alanine amidase n=1 Tax=Paenibacillus hodogayensis TaxID=279208 RepID=A0ABV5VWC9_9BACL